MKARVYVTLKPGLLDVQGKTVKSALEALGFKGVKDVRVGKCIELELANGRGIAAQKAVEQMCRKLLANPIVETYRIEVGKT